jgi:hypothetical protein
MLRDLFGTAGDIGIYGILSTILFVVFFTLLVLRTVFIKRRDVEAYSRMPLDDGSEKKDEIQEI